MLWAAANVKNAGWQPALRVALAFAACNDERFLRSLPDGLDRNRTALSYPQPVQVWLKAHVFLGLW